MLTLNNNIVSIFLCISVTENIVMLLEETDRMIEKACFKYSQVICPYTSTYYKNCIKYIGG